MPVEDKNKSVKVNKWDRNAVKNALDDAARKVLVEKFEFKESHFLLDLRLGIFTMMICCAICALVFDIKQPYPKSHFVLAVITGIYVMLAVVVTLFMFLIEKNIICVAYEKDKTGVGKDNTWRVTSHMTKVTRTITLVYETLVRRYTGEYEVELSCSNGATGITHSAGVTKSVGCFFDEAGFLHYDVFEQDLIKLKETLTSDKKTQ